MVPVFYAASKQGRLVFSILCSYYSRAVFNGGWILFKEIQYFSGSQTFFIATPLQKYAELATPQS